MTRILILGGTREASELAARLVAEGHEVTTSLAGRTREPEPPAGRIRIGGFGGAPGLAEFLVAARIEKLIDATHPFAEQISANAHAASAHTGIPLEVRNRPAWERQNGDRWHEVANLVEARDAIPPCARVLLALGSQHIAVFASREDVFFLVRMVDPPIVPLALANHQLLIGKPGKDAGEEAELLSRHRISHVVSRNSGGIGAYAKIKAARSLGLPVIMVSRSDSTHGKTT